MKSFSLNLFIISILLCQAANLFGQKQTKVWISPDSLKAFREHFRRNIPEPKGYVADFEGLFSNKEENKFDSIIQRYKYESGSAIYVVSLDTIRVAKLKFDDLVQGFADAYNLNSKKTNGILIVVSKGYQKIKIKTSPNLERNWQSEDLSSLMNQMMIPSFKEKQYFEGVWSAVVAFCQQK
jgi:uncharacterized protein